MFLRGTLILRGLHNLYHALIKTNYVNHCEESYENCCG